MNAERGSRATSVRAPCSAAPAPSWAPSTGEMTELTPVSNGVSDESEPAQPATRRRPGSGRPCSDHATDVTPTPRSAEGPPGGPDEAVLRVDDRSTWPVDSTRPECRRRGRPAARAQNGKSPHPPPYEAGHGPIGRGRADRGRRRRNRRSRSSRPGSVLLVGSWLSVRKGPSSGAKRGAVIVEIGSKVRRLESIPISP